MFAKSFATSWSLRKEPDQRQAPSNCMSFPMFWVQPSELVKNVEGPLWRSDLSHERAASLQSAWEAPRNGEVFVSRLAHELTLADKQA